MNNIKMYKYGLISTHTGQLLKEVIGTKSQGESSGKQYIYNGSEVVAIVPYTVLILIEAYIPKSDSEKALDALKTYSGQ